MNPPLRPLDLGEGAREELLNRNYLDWVAQAFGESGLGVSGFALFILFAGAIGLFNWTESFKVPTIWLVLMTPLVASALPVPVVWRLVGLITVAVATLFTGLWIYWRRM